MQLIIEFTFPPSALRCRSRNQICVEVSKNCNCRPTPQERQCLMSANQPNNASCLQMNQTMPNKDKDGKREVSCRLRR